jgi:hypothetical protein
MGPQLLDDWIERMHFKTNKDAADFLELDESVVTKLRSGLRAAGLTIAVRLYGKTGIPVHAWSDESDSALMVSAAKGRKSHKDK